MSKTLFLDRDGVINRRIAGSYVTRWEEFVFIPGTLEALLHFKDLFDTIVVVTNQQGIDRGIFTAEALDGVHQRMLEVVTQIGGRIDKVYYCPKLAKLNPECRKPNTGMGLQAQADFPNIDFANSIMVGDSASDIEFGQRLGMQTVLIETKIEDFEITRQMDIDFRFNNLLEFANFLSIENQNSFVK